MGVLRPWPTVSVEATQAEVHDWLRDQISAILGGELAPEGMTPETFTKWLKSAEVNDSGAPGSTWVNLWPQRPIALGTPEPHVQRENTWVDIRGYADQLMDDSDCAIWERQRERINWAEIDASQVDWASEAARLALPREIVTERLVTRQRVFRATQADLEAVVAAMLAEEDVIATRVVNVVGEPGANGVPGLNIFKGGGA